jgi:phosphonate transport system substrate-binding protein
MAQNADAMCRDLTSYLGQQLGLPTEFVDNVPWQKREQLFDAGQIDLCWICGLPYVQKIDLGADIEICAAPVMKSERYGDQPVYFSDVIVRSDSPYRSFSDLRGVTWAYNEPRSHSGFNIVCDYLARGGYTLDYFSRLLEAGSHQSALRLILAGDVAAAAIDSTVLDAEFARTPQCGTELRSIAVLGPSPAPPWVMSKTLPADLRDTIRRCLTAMSADAAGRRILDSWGISELRAVADAAYDPIRNMEQSARRAFAMPEPMIESQ